MHPRRTLEIGIDDDFGRDTPDQVSEMPGSDVLLWMLAPLATLCIGTLVGMAMLIPRLLRQQVRPGLAFNKSANASRTFVTATLASADRPGWACWRSSNERRRLASCRCCPE